MLSLKSVVLPSSVVSLSSVNFFQIEYAASLYPILSNIWLEYARKYCPEIGAIEIFIFFASIFFINSNNKKSVKNGNFEVLGNLLNFLKCDHKTWSSKRV